MNTKNLISKHERYNSKKPPINGRLSSPAHKRALIRAAKDRKLKYAQLVSQIVEEWLIRHDYIDFTKNGE